MALKATLYPYQTEGVQWMLERETTYSGGINADEVGLGKTLMTIATIIKNPKPKTLILAPKSLVPQWEKEMAKFSTIKPYVNELPKDKESFVVIASHSKIVKRKAKENETEYHDIQWDRVVIDEAHVIKNNTSKINKSARSLPSKIRWALTATPVMNNMAEFVNMMQWIGVEKTSCIQKKLEVTHTYILRRTKEDVAKIDDRLELPKLDIQIKEVPFKSEEEIALYEQQWKDSRDIIKKMKKSEYLQNNALEALEQLLRMRQISIHPQIYNTGMAKKRKESPEPWNHGSSKMNALVELLKDHQEKSLVFCHFIEEIDLYTQAIEDAGFKTVRLDGSMDLETRQNMVHTFNSDFEVKVFLIQIHTGGVGYNLQIASRVYITEPTWNPSIEYQAIGRAHRTGQKKPVQVVKLISTHPELRKPTVEQYILALHDKKNALVAEILNDPRIAEVEKGAKARKVGQHITFSDIAKMF